MLVLTRAEVEHSFSAADAYAAAERAAKMLATGDADAPLQTLIRGPSALTGIKPGRIPGVVGVKLVSLRRANAVRGLPSVPATILLLDDETGLPRALLDGTALTWSRTAAASAVASRHLARPDARVLAIVGAGAQAASHLVALRHAFPALADVRVHSRTLDSARAFAARHPGVRAVATASAAVDQADIVCLCTSSSAPVIDGKSLASHAHVNAVGAFTPTTRELDDETVRRASKIVADSKAAVLHESGDLLIPMAAGILGKQPIHAELGEILLGTRPGREASDGITVYKSVGNAIQDLVAAECALANAVRAGLGREIEI